MTASAWTIAGEEGLPIHGDTHHPERPARAVAVIVHGWTGSKDRNIVPALAVHARSIGLVAHRFTFGHAGIEQDADRITRHDEFTRDSLAFQFGDLRRIIGAIDRGDIAGRGLPLVLIGHSRGGATVLGAAARAHREDWPIAPAGVIAIAAPCAYTRLSDAARAELERNGFVEAELARAEGGSVRMGPSWYAHHDEHPGRDLFLEDLDAARGPILLLHGEADAAVTPDHAERILGRLRANERTTARLVRLAGGDHNLGAIGFGFDHRRSQTSAMEAAAAAIEAFLDEIAPAR